MLVVSFWRGELARFVAESHLLECASLVVESLVSLPCLASRLASLLSSMLGGWGVCHLCVRCLAWLGLLRALWGFSKNSRGMARVDYFSIRGQFGG